MALPRLRAGEHLAQMVALGSLRERLLGENAPGVRVFMNAITGGSFHTANYAGVTVERKEGISHDAASGRDYRVLRSVLAGELDPADLIAHLQDNNLFDTTFEGGDKETEPYHWFVNVPAGAVSVTVPGKISWPVELVVN